MYKNTSMVKNWYSLSSVEKQLLLLPVFSCRASSSPVMPPYSPFFPNESEYWTITSCPGQKREKDGRACWRRLWSAAGGKVLQVEGAPAGPVHTKEG